MGGFISSLFLIVLFAATAGPAQAGSQAAPLSTPELRQAIGAGKKTLVFFLNPNGGPCRVQNDILTQLQKDKKNSFTIAYVNAMNPDHQRAFYDYGVRSLPMLVLVDKSGNIGRVFPPGIQRYETLEAALEGAK